MLDFFMGTPITYNQVDYGVDWSPVLTFFFKLCFNKHVCEDCSKYSWSFFVLPFFSSANQKPETTFARRLTIPHRFKLEFDS